MYLSFQPTGLAELLSAWGEGLSSSSASTGNTSSFVPPDDSALRASIDSTLFDQVSAEIAFTASTYERSGDSAVYYAFGSAEMPSLPQDQVLFVAAPAVGDARQAAIASISESDFYILVRVAFSETATGSIAPSAVLCARADVDKGKPIVFVDADQNILYVQTLTALADNSAPTQSADPERARSRRLRGPERFRNACALHLHRPRRSPRPRSRRPRPPRPRAERSARTSLCSRSACRA